MNAVVLSVGSELLRGDILDTNAAFLARELSNLGFRVDRVAQLPDRLDLLTDAFRDALAQATVTLSTGGLGPTQDDLTRQAIAAAVGEVVYVDDELLEGLRRRFEGMRRPMTRNNVQQAQLIPSASAIPNPNGTAPGWLVERDGRLVVAMPGPPSEMQPMWRERVLSRVAALQAGQVAMLGLMTFGIGESALERQIADVISWNRDVIVATYAKSNGVQVHVTARAASREEATGLLDETVSRLRDILGDTIFGTDDETLAAVVAQTCASRSLTLGSMESCTGGAVAEMITDIDGSSEFFIGGMVAYTREAKALYGVPEEIMDTQGLISPETALAMARAVRASLGTDLGIGTTGVAGGEPVEGQPPGTCFVAVSAPDGEQVREIHRPGARNASKRFFAQCALDLLRLHLVHTASEIL